MDHTSIVFGSSISSPSLTTESPEVYNSDAQSPIYGSLDDIGTFSGNGDQDIDGNMYHTSGKFGSSQYSPSLAAESSEEYNSDAQSSICDDYGTFGGNSDRDSDGNMDDDDAAEDDDEHVIDDDVFNAVVSCCHSDSLSLPNNVVVVVVFSYFIPYVPSSAFLSPPPQLRRTMCTESSSCRRIKAETDFSSYKTALCSQRCRGLRRVQL
jgi:hypothetical protein